jgi:hypothetical protein
MEDVITFQLYTWCYTKAFSIANSAIRRYIIRHSPVLILLYAFRFKAWEAFSLISEASAWMLTILMNIDTGLLHSLLTIRLVTHFLKCHYVTLAWLIDLSLTESTFALFQEFFELFASHALVIGFNLAVRAENLSAIKASYSVKTYVYSRFTKKVNKRSLLGHRVTKPVFQA